MIDNIFTALARKRTPGVILEFVLWCVVCFTTLMSLIALAMGEGHVTWILLLLFSAGMAVLMAFRLKAVVMLYGAGVFYLLTFLLHFLLLSIGFSCGISRSPLNLVLFLLILLLSLAVVVCAFVQFFSRYHLGTLLTVLTLCDTAAIVLLNILMYAADYLGDEYSDVNGGHRAWMNARGYWIGTAAFWLLLAVTAVYYAAFFWGPIDQEKGKLSTGGKGSVKNQLPPGMQGICGANVGRVIYLQGKTMTIGSAEGVDVRISDPYVSQIHCAVRFNPYSGCYEVFDQSTNGVRLSNGIKLQKGVYHSVRRGDVVCIGSMEQQFRLL